MSINGIQQVFSIFLRYLKKHPIQSNGLLLLASVAVVLLCFEIGFRIYIAQTQPDLAKIIQQFTWETANENTRQRFEPHPYLSYAPSKIQYKPNGIQIGKELFAFKKIGNTLRIACLGASTTMNQYPQYLKEKLSQTISQSYMYEVMDFGCDGWTLTESTVNYLIRIQDFSPDFVIVHHGMNDLAGRMWPHYKPDYTHYRKTYDEHILGHISREYLSFSWMMTYLLFQSGMSSIDIINLTTHTIPHEQLNHNPDPETLEAFARNLKTLHTVVHSHNGQLIYAPMAYNSEKAQFYDPKLIEEFNTRGTEIAHENNIPVVDTHTHLKNHPDWFKDIVHLNQEGNKLKAEQFAMKIAEMVQSTTLSNVK